MFADFKYQAKPWNKNPLQMFLNDWNLLKGILHPKWTMNKNATLVPFWTKKKKKGQWSQQSFLIESRKNIYGYLKARKW